MVKQFTKVALPIKLVIIIIVKQLIIIELIMEQLGEDTMKMIQIIYFNQIDLLYFVYFKEVELFNHCHRSLQL